MWRVFGRVAMSPGGEHSSENCRFEECAPPGDVATVHTVFPIHPTHVPVNFTWVMWPLVHKIALHLTALITLTTVTRAPSLLQRSGFSR